MFRSNKLEVLFISSQVVNCVTSNVTTNLGTRFAITDTKHYVPVVNL